MLTSLDRIVILARSFGPKPIRAGSHLPDIVVVLNPSENLALIKECNISNIPTVGIVDTDTDPRIVTYAIPANMEVSPGDLCAISSLYRFDRAEKCPVFARPQSMRTAELIASTISLAGQAGREKRLNANAPRRDRR